MPKKPKVQKPAGCVTAKQLLKSLGIAERTLRSWIAAGMPVKVAGRGGRPSYYDPLEVTAWRLDRAKEPAQEGQSDLFPDGDGSPALEEFRRQRARQAKMSADEQEGSLIRRDDVLVVVVDVFTTLRTEFETLERMYGREIGDQVRAMLDRAQDGVLKKMGARDAAAAAAAPPAKEGETGAAGQSVA